MCKSEKCIQNLYVVFCNMILFPSMYTYSVYYILYHGASMAQRALQASAYGGPQERCHASCLECLFHFLAGFFFTTLETLLLCTHSLAIFKVLLRPPYLKYWNENDEPSEHLILVQFRMDSLQSLYVRPSLSLPSFVRETEWSFARPFGGDGREGREAAVSAESSSSSSTILMEGFVFLFFLCLAQDPFCTLQATSAFDLVASR